MTASNVINILSFKDKLLVTIFCSYDDEALKRVNNLKEHMVKKGYLICRMVSDYSYPVKRKNENSDQYFLRKSIYWLEQSDVCIFVLFGNVENDGVVLEIKHACDHLPSKLETSLVAIESKGSRVSTCLIRGTISNQVNLRKLTRRFFVNDVQLCRFCCSASKSFLRKRILYLIDRQGKSI
jgi:hypothetical protein